MAEVVQKKLLVELEQAAEVRRLAAALATGRRLILKLGRASCCKPPAVEAGAVKGC